MIYRYPQAALWRRGATVALVLALHAALLWALVSGLAYRVTPPARTEIVARIVDAPPPTVRAQPAPSLPAKAPVEARVKTPVTPPTKAPAPVLSPARPIAPVLTEPRPAADAAPVQAASEPAAAQPAAERSAQVLQPHPATPVSAAAGLSVLCPGYVDAIRIAGYPAQAIEAGLGRGDVLLELNLGPEGRVQGVRVLQASDRIFARAAVEAAKRLQCQGTGVPQRVNLPIAYRPPQGP